MDLLEAYALLDGDIDAYTPSDEMIAAAKTMLAHPEVMNTAPGRVGRAVRDIVVELFDVEEDF